MHVRLDVRVEPQHAAQTSHSKNANKAAMNGTCEKAYEPADAFKGGLAGDAATVCVLSPLQETQTKGPADSSLKTLQKVTVSVLYDQTNQPVTDPTNNKIFELDMLSFVRISVLCENNHQFKTTACTGTSSKVTKETIIPASRGSVAS